VRFPCEFYTTAVRDGKLERVGIVSTLLSHMGESMSARSSAQCNDQNGVLA